jgi:hypothetical protein
MKTFIVLVFWLAFITAEAETSPAEAKYSCPRNTNGNLPIIYIETTNSRSAIVVKSTKRMAGNSDKPLLCYEIMDCPEGQQRHSATNKCDGINNFREPKTMHRFSDHTEFGIKSNNTKEAGKSRLDLRVFLARKSSRSRRISY